MTPPIDPLCRVGVAVILRRPDGRILMGRRRGPMGDGQWSVPGGKLERGETPIGCAERELKEETGIQHHGIQMLPIWTRDGGHPEWPDYVTLWASAYYASWMDARVLEPEKCAEWRWVSKDELPTPLFRCFATLLRQYDPWRLV